jgi:prepilin signal peptidase PulO-like enzyme (type II secretory pathway)
MGKMQLLIGGILGTACGLGAWLVARLCAQPDPVESGGVDALPQRLDLQGTRGAVMMPLALAMAVMALWGGYLGWQAPGLERLVAALTLTGLLLAISLVDLSVRRVPNVLLVVLLLWAAGQMLWLGQPTPVSAAIGLLIGGGLFLLAAWLGRGAMGLGDVKLAAVLGVVLGYPLIFPGLLAGVLAGGLAALALLLAGRAGRKDTMAYAPYLALGALFVWTRSMGLLL